MRIQINKQLFAWDSLEDSPTLKTIQQLLDVIPDEALLAQLEASRGKGRNDYSVRTLWGVLVLSIALRHQNIEACLAELRRNESLRKLIGVESEDRVPPKWVLSRFLEKLGTEPHLTLLHQVFDALIQRLGESVPDLGRNTAGDATSLNARRRKTALAEEEQEQGLPQASGGRKEYTDDDGKVNKVVEWFGFKLHLLVDVKHEVSLAYKITDTKAGDGETLPAVLADAQRNLPDKRIETLAYDKAADTNAVHQLLSAASIKPVIQNRSLWKEEHEKMLPGHDGNSNIVYDEAGTVHCYDRVSEPIVRHKMSYIGYEPQRETLKYRCPAMHEGFECPMAKFCNANKSYGLTVRVPRDIDLRRFPSLPRATMKFERLYKGRTAVERVNARLKIFWGADDGNVTGSRRFFALLGVVLAVHGAFATLLAMAPRYEGTLGQTRLSPIAKALHGKIKPKQQPPVRRKKPVSRERQELLQFTA
ncbi:MAG: transposase [Pirellulaceae bacterium]|nr:transposase [Pirellulaceae bacterium]